MTLRTPTEMKIQSLSGLVLVFMVGFILASNIMDTRFSPNAAAIGNFSPQPVCPMTPYLETWNCAAEAFSADADVNAASTQATEVCKRNCFSHTQSFVDACNDYCNVGHAVGSQGGQTLHCSVGNMSAQLASQFCDATCYFDQALQQYVCEAQGYIQYQCDCAAI